jgi:hypothetical protein
MNGRIYDPTLGRFLQADPFIQAPMNSQSYNRYSYVLNNPLSYTDPSGYFFKKLFKAIGGNKFLSTIISIGLNFIPGCQAWCSAAFNAAITYAVTGSLKGALIGAFVGAISPGGFNPGAFLARAAIGGLASRLQGGKFGHGFIAAGASGAAGGIGNVPLRMLASAVIGGTVSKITGGKFANGASSAAFATLVTAGFNGELRSRKNTLADGGSNSFDNNVTVNDNLKDNVTVDGKNVSISVSLSGEGSVSQEDLDWYASSIESDFAFSDDELSLSVDVTVVKEGGDLTLTNCTVSVCVRNDQSGKRFMAAGAAERGGSKIWHSTIQFSRSTTPAHEFGHILGFGHQPPNTNRIMSYDSYREVGKFETQMLINAYGN